MQKLIFSPLALFAFSIISSYLIWLLLPDLLYYDAGIRQQVSWDVPLIVASWALSAFFIGWAAGGLPRLNPSRAGNDPALVYRTLKVGNLLATIAMVILLANTVRVYGVGGLLLSARGLIRPEHIEGVTTWVHLSTLTMTAALVFRTNMVNPVERRRFMVQAAWGFSLALVRGLGNGERLAVLIPLVATLLGLVIIGRKQIIIRAVAISFALALMLVGIFTASELMRSYRAKLQDGMIDSGAVSYSVNRLMLYYASSVNAGAAMFEYSRVEVYRQPFLLTTLNPVAQIIYRLPGMNFMQRQQSSSVGYHTLVKEGYRPQELTNIWGIACPFTEGHLWGMFYWVIWGFFSRIVWLNAMASRQASWWLVCLGLIGAGLLDCGRILSIGSIHILLPLAIALFLALRSKTKVASVLRTPLRRSA